jgi:hypothetical protein
MAVGVSEPLTLLVSPVRPARTLLKIIIIDIFLVCFFLIDD